jgi:hypothetical protein
MAGWSSRRVKQPLGPMIIVFDGVVERYGHPHLFCGFTIDKLELFGYIVLEYWCYF